MSERVTGAGLGTPAPRIGIIYGGICWQRMAWDSILDSFDLIDTYQISRTHFPSWFSLLDYDIVIVPWAPDQRFLRDRSREIIRFLQGGGILLAFGEFDENWLPLTSWRSVLLNDITIELADHPIFANISSDDLCNWDDSAHGAFTAYPHTSKILATGAQKGSAKQVVGFVDHDSFEGVVLALTMDPDFHAYNGVAEARRFLTNCVQWAISQYFILVKKGGLRKSRRLVHRHRRLDLLMSVSFEIVICLIVALLVYILPIF